MNKATKESIFKDYESTIEVPVNRHAAYRAITEEMSEWWTEMSGRFTKKGDRATASFPDGTTWSFEAVTMQPDRMVELACYHANHVHPVTTDEMRDEWEGTTLQFGLQDSGEGTQIRFRHKGLTPNMNCYELCSTGWDHFFAASLKKYLESRVS